VVAGLKSLGPQVRLSCRSRLAGSTLAFSMIVLCPNHAAILRFRGQCHIVLLIPQPSQSPRRDRAKIVVMLLKRLLCPVVQRILLRLVGQGQYSRWVVTQIRHNDDVNTLADLGAAEP
jgi:hypothetical protein